MDFIKNKSSYPVQMVVRASRSGTVGNYKRKTHTNKMKEIEDRLPSPIDYYPKELKKFHRNSKQASALCPFHDDRNPSFSVNLKSGAFLCFSCDARGRTLISFHQKKYGFSWERACKDLGVWHE